MICKWWHPMWKKIHVELEFLRIQFHHFLSQQSVRVELEFLRLEFDHFLLDQTVRESSSSSHILSHLLLHFFIPDHFIYFSDHLLFQIYFSKLFLCFSRSLFYFSKFFLRFWLPIWFFDSSSSSSADTSLELEFEKLKFHVDILL